MMGVRLTELDQHRLRGNLILIIVEEWVRVAMFSSVPSSTNSEVWVILSALRLQKHLLYLETC